MGAGELGEIIGPVLHCINGLSKTTAAGFSKKKKVTAPVTDANGVFLKVGICTPGRGYNHQNVRRRLPWQSYCFRGGKP